AGLSRCKAFALIPRTALRVRSGTVPFASLARSLDDARPMAAPVSIAFPLSTAQAFDSVKVRRYELRQALSELFELTLEILCSDSQLDPFAVVGQPIVVSFEGEPF